MLDQTGSERGWPTADIGGRFCSWIPLLKRHFLELASSWRSVSSTRDDGPMPTVLIAFPESAGVVLLENGEIHLTHDVSDGGSLLSGRGHIPASAWLGDDRSLVGGLLPPGAVSVEVVDDRGVRVDAMVQSGVYAAIVDQPNDGQHPVVCCRDVAGAVVRRPLSGDYECSPVDDAREPCPACGAIAYDECVPRQRSSAGHVSADDPVTSPKPMVVCRVCGHEEPGGPVMRVISRVGQDEGADAEQIVRARVARVHRWHADKLVLAAITFPIYAAEGWPAYICSRNRTGDTLSGVTVAHTKAIADNVLDDPTQIAMEITTSTRRSHQSDVGLARVALEQWVHQGGDYPSSTEHSGSAERSDAALALSLRAVTRRRSAAVLRATFSETHIAVDGTPQPFLTLTTTSGRWAGVRRHGDITITVTARDVDPATVQLQAILDPVAALLGPEPPSSR